jgi:hypothetical protein
MKGAATTSPHSPNESDEPDVPDEAEVTVEVEQKIKVDEILADDDTTGIQSILEVAAELVSLSGATTKKTVPAIGPKKPNAKKPSPSKRKTLASKAKKPGIPSDYQVFLATFFRNSAGTSLIMAQRLFLVQNMVQTMYLRIGFTISGRGTQVIYWQINTRVA